MRATSDHVDVGAIESVDQSALECRYCGCDQSRPCLLGADCVPVTSTGLSRGGYVGEPCGWHRIVELLDDRGGHAGYFAVCTNAECVRAYLADRSAP